MEFFTLWFMILYPATFHFFAYCWTFAAIAITVSELAHLFSALKKRLKPFIRKKNRIMQASLPPGEGAFFMPFSLNGRAADL